MPTRIWARCLRNALSHGGIVYLDADGRQAAGRPTESMGFVSAQYVDGKMWQPPEQLLALRITQAAYLQFLRNWVAWLHSSGLAKALAA